VRAELCAPTGLIQLASEMDTSNLAVGIVGSPELAALGAAAVAPLADATGADQIRGLAEQIAPELAGFAPGLAVRAYPVETWAEAVAGAFDPPTAPSLASLVVEVPDTQVCDHEDRIEALEAEIRALKAERDKDKRTILRLRQRFEGSAFKSLVEYTDPPELPPDESRYWPD
jgi:hypothetical protein